MSLHRALATLCLTAPVLFAASPIGAAGTCTKTSGTCTSTTTLSLAGPVIICQVGDDVVKVESSAQCSGGSAGPAVTYRCSSSNQAFVYGGGGLLHVLRPTPGSDWGDALASCGALAYSVAQ